jgi:type IV secretory pathway VirB3-like protein
LRGTSAGIQQRLTALEGIVKGINKAAWLIGIPILLAAIFGVINAAILVWRKVM